MDASFLAGPCADFPAQPQMFSNEVVFLSKNEGFPQGQLRPFWGEPVMGGKR